MNLVQNSAKVLERGFKAKKKKYYNLLLNILHLLSIVWFLTFKYVGLNYYLNFL